MEDLRDIEKNCHIELISLINELDVENGYYMPEKEFAKIMKSCKRGLNLAYGMKSTEESYLFSITGYIRLVICIIEDINRDLKWELRP